jgi:GAF domain.
MSTATCSTELRVLLAISKVIDQALDLESALESILKILSDTMSMRRATLTLYDPLSGRLAISTSYGLSAQEKQRGVYRMDEGITGIIFAQANLSSFRTFPRNRSSWTKPARGASAASASPSWACPFFCTAAPSGS